MVWTFAFFLSSLLVLWIHGASFLTYMEFVDAVKVLFELLWC